MSYVSPQVLMLEGGTYEVEFPQNVAVNTKAYRFSKWDDNSLNPKRILVLNQDKMIVANYVEVINVADVTFSGVVSPTTAGPRSITITVTLPNSTKDILPTVLTDDQGNYSTSKQYLAGVYSAKADVAEDAYNKVGASAEKPFVVGKSDTTISLEIMVS